MQPKPLMQDQERPTSPAQHLCDRCVHSPSCSLRANQTARVHLCEEYDDGSTEIAQRPPALVSIPVVSASPGPLQETVAGLCGTCDHRAECHLPKAIGGVWFCEEYR